MVSVPPEMLVQKQFRDVAPTLVAVPGLPLYAAPPLQTTICAGLFR